MKGYMPQQVEVWYIIPAIRKEFAKAMIAKGMTQKATAETLGVTEAAISQYIKNKRAKEEINFGKDIEKKIEESIELIIQGADVLGETKKICDLARKNGVVCTISKKMGLASKSCCICMK